MVSKVLITFLVIAVAVVNQTQEQGVPQKEEAVYEASETEIRGHIVWPREIVVRRVASGRQEIFQAIKLKLIVDAEGSVLWAHAVEGPPDSYAAAEALAKNWKYVPFEKDGVATKASVEDYARVLPPERLPKAHRDFPKVGGGADVVMTLSRSGCFGSCPAYSVAIHGDGTVLYEGNSFVVVTGQHRDKITPDQVNELIGLFEKADYFSLEDSYESEVTDCPMYKTSFSVGNVKKDVSDYVGDEVGMPQAVTDIEGAIDRIAETSKWIRGTAETVASLKSEGYNFKSAEAASMLTRAMQKGGSDFARDLIAEGVSASGKGEEGNSALSAAARLGDEKTLDMLITAGAGRNDVDMKTQALSAAALSGNLEMVKKLLSYGGDPNRETVEEQEARTVLMSAAASSVPGIVEAILAERPNVNAVDRNGRAALWYVTEGNSYRDEELHADRARIVHMLAKAGANLNAQDNGGDTALHHAYYEGVAKALIEEGANVNVRNAAGETPLMVNSSLEMAKLLVAAGANTHAKDQKGWTALDHAMELEPTGERTKYLRSLGIEEGRRAKEAEER